MAKAKRATSKQVAARTKFKAKVKKAKAKYNAKGNKKSWATCMKEA